MKLKGSSRIFSIFLTVLFLTDTFGGHTPAIGATETTDPKTHRLCAEAAAPDAAPDKVFITCELDTGSFAPESPHPFDGKITVAAYNLERGFTIEKQIELFKRHPAFMETDVLLISESDRGCPRTGFRNITRDFAGAMGMNYAYAVEFVELPRGENWKEPCEHGNAILSRFPMSNIREIRHRSTGRWYIPPQDRDKGGEPRLGGRVAVAADITFGSTTARFYSVHFESGLNDDDIRADEAAQLVEDAAKFSGPVVIGGDMNTHKYVINLQGASSMEPTIKVFQDNGYSDAHENIPSKKRGTTRVEYGIRTVIDLFFLRGFSATDGGRCPTKICDPLSDHLPVWTKLEVDE